MKNLTHSLFLFFTGLLLQHSAFATFLPNDYIIPQETLSPSGHYGFTVPIDKILGDTKNVHNSLVDIKAEKVIAVVDTWPGYDHRLNHVERVPPWWSEDESLVLWKVHGKWCPEALVLIKLNHGVQEWQLNLLTIFQKKILERTRAAAPKEYEAAKKRNAGNGAAFPDGFTVDVEVVGESDPHPIFTYENSKETKSLYQRPALKFPIEVHTTLTSNPKQIENAPTLSTEMDGVVKEGGTIKVKQFKVLSL